MKFEGAAASLQRLMCAVAILVSLFFTQACGKLDPPRSEYDMGERVRVGSLTYTVVETVWKNQLGDFPAARVPERNFLLMRLSVTNAGGIDRNMPPLQLETESGDTFPEIMDGQGVTGWLGLLRKIPPAQTEDGWVVFDVPTNSYKLKIADTNDAGAELVALVNIKLTIPPESPGTGIK
jgi:hypothetical protein